MIVSRQIILFVVYVCVFGFGRRWFLLFNSKAYFLSLFCVSRGVYILWCVLPLSRIELLSAPSILTTVRLILWSIAIRYSFSTHFITDTSNTPKNFHACALQCKVAITIWNKQKLRTFGVKLLSNKCAGKKCGDGGDGGDEILNNINNKQKESRTRDKIKNGQNMKWKTYVWREKQDNKFDNHTPTKLEKKDK